MTRREKYILATVMLWVLILVNSIVALVFPGAGLLPGLAVSGFAGMAVVYRIQDRRARKYRDQALRLASHLMDETGLYQKQAKNPDKCKTCTKQQGCPTAARARVKLN